MKVCVICFDFKESNIRLQPWTYIYNISMRMVSKDIDVEIISNGYPKLPQIGKVGGVTVFRLRQLRSFPFNINTELVTLVNERAPDAILWLIGPTSFHFIRTFGKINQPIIGLWMGTIYKLSQIWSLGPGEIIRNFFSIYIHIINTLIPSLLTKYLLKTRNLKKIIVLNENNKDMVSDYGFLSENISVIPPGTTEYNFELPDLREIRSLREEKRLEDDDFIVLYLGSPLSLRGTDTLIDAISIACKNITSLKLIILSRCQPNTSLSNKERYIRKLCKKRGISNRTNIISGILDRNDIKNFIFLSDVVALPFKLVQADTPVSILEVMALGKPVISTEIDGIPELLEGGRGYLVKRNDPACLADAILDLYLNPKLRKEIGEKAKEYMFKHLTWDQATQNILILINKIVDQSSNMDVNL